MLLNGKRPKAKSIQKYFKILWVFRGESLYKELHFIEHKRDQRQDWELSENNDCILYSWPSFFH